MAEIDKFLESLSKRLESERFGRNEVWHRAWLEVQAKKQNQILQCPECGAFVPLRPDNFDSGGKRICLLCGERFFAEEY